jgi:hypothetical protein
MDRRSALKLAEPCGELFAEHQRDAFGGTFHLSDLAASPRLSSWWSAHHALCIRHLDEAAAVEELRTVYSACQLEDGSVASDRLLEPDLPDTRDPLARVRDSAGRSPLIAPPLAAYVAARLSIDGSDAQRDLLDCATRQLDAIWATRLPPDTALPVILHPLESPTPTSPLFDSLVESTEPDEWIAEAANLVRSAVACRLDPERALRAGHSFVVEDPAFCGWFLLALEEVASALALLDDASVAGKLRFRAEMIAEALVARLWSEDDEIFIGFDRQRSTRVARVTAAGLIPGASRMLLAEGTAKRTVERYMRTAASLLWHDNAIAFNPRDPDSDSANEIWRGKTAPAVLQYWGHLVLTRASRTADARALREQLESRIDRHGFAESYHAESGEPLPGGNATSGALVLEMQHQEASQ